MYPFQNLGVSGWYKGAKVGVNGIGWGEQGSESNNKLMMDLPAWSLLGSG